MGDVNILSIESSCDETACAIVKNGKEILSNVIHTQIDIHTLYGGVVPEIASRNHLEKVDDVVYAALKEANCTFSDIDAVAVTKGPGLIGALLVGTAFGKAMAYSLKKPLIGVHHIDGHISAVYIEHDIKPPFMCLVASGGHTSLINVVDYGVYEHVAKAGDDAAGEAFDKVARAIGLGYPGGPKIEKAAKLGDPFAFSLPHPKIGDSFDFSFSGLKTAVLNAVNQYKMRGEEIPVNDVAASFQRTVIETLISHTMAAMKDRGVTRLALCGGVAANLTLKEAFKEACQREAMDFFTPNSKFCTDNAAMIGVAAYHMYKKGLFSDLDLNATASLKL